MARENKVPVMWDFLSTNPNCSVKEISVAASVGRAYADRIIKEWVRKRFVLVTEKGRGRRPTRFSVCGDNKPSFDSLGKTKRQYKKTIHQKLWNNMKISTFFTFNSLIGPIQGNKNTAKKLVLKLEAADYVRCVFKAKNSLQKNRYQLIRDTGRLVPIIHSNGCWDQNEKKLYPYKVSDLSSHHSGEEAHHDLAG
ncbi:hypothetical protein [Enterovibrio baiacu]|uniref:hypothetical protein n=1 Tax=Enterovibrio baiacu TaxID=2491023 RepID=UPI003D124CA5